MKENFIPRRPDYNVSVMNKDTDKKGNIGVAWKKEDGTITIKLNPFVVLDFSENLIVILFPVAPRKKTVNGEFVQPLSDYAESHDEGFTLEPEDS